MGRVAAIKGRMTQGDEPDWGPLETTVGIEVVGDFMWMYEVELDDGRHVQSYKHRDTRCYVHLDADCNAFVYETPGRYRSIDIVRLLELVFDRLPGLYGVTDEQIQASWRAVDRLERAQDEPAEPRA
ncbi:MAG: ribonuclease VapC [Solirubrobacteraceae bacterium]|jgi:hypothetical protein|nr:ribonuclease VapC [Solirubrobacteraceae bacterium]